jgi:hypothetical protein
VRSNTIKRLAQGLYANIGFLKKMDAASPDAFTEFAKSKPAFVENKIIAFLSSERTRAQREDRKTG